jgi:hypothetical protein
LSQRPPQHSKSSLQASPFCVQKEGLASQRPSVQRLEQQSSLTVHTLPEVLQFVLRGVQTSPSQVPPQHSAPSVQASPSEVHWTSEQVPPVQEKEQQSGPTVQAPELATQMGTGAASGPASGPASGAFGSASGALGSESIAVPPSSSPPELFEPQPHRPTERTKSVASIDRCIVK